jgi:serine-type D-Ala-D-Ala carboxypeptidase (penicillin-binding protein 5/6)
MWSQKSRIIVQLGWVNLFFSIFVVAEPLKFDIEGEAAILMNAESGAILFEYKGDTPHYPASTTKVAAALYALKLKGNALEMPITAEQDSLTMITPEKKRNSNYELPAYWLESDGTHIGIQKGEIFTMHDLLKGMLIPSGNDAANVVAHALGPTIPHFMEGLNAYLKEIGCKNTHFCNPHGLHHPRHITTAYDLALMTREALKNPIFGQIVSQSRFLRPKTNKQSAATLLGGNRLIRSGKFYYARAIGVKTGYHAKAKNTFIGAARADGRTLIVVLLGYPDRKKMFEEAIKLFEAAFNQPKVRRLFFKAGPQAFKQKLPKADRFLKTYLSEDLSLNYYPAEDPEAKCFLCWQPLPLPVKKDQKVGELHLVSSGDVVLKKIPLWAEKEVKLAWPYSWLTSVSSVSWLLIFGGGLAGILLFSAVWKVLGFKSKS